MEVKIFEIFKLFVSKKKDFYCVEITTVEGIIDRAVRGLEQDQVVRRKEHPEIAAKIDDFVAKLNDLKALKAPFKLVST